MKKFVVCIFSFYISIILNAQNIPTQIELKQYEPTEKNIISGSHGDAEIVLGWWGWYGMTNNVAKVLNECAEKAIAEPEKYKYSFEYDAASWLFYDKYYPDVITKIREAVQLGSWEVTGGTYSIHLPYMVGIESNVRQWTIGQNSLYEILGTSADVFHFQEFLLFPQLPMYLRNVGINNSFYENHLAITGNLDKNWRGIKEWRAANGLSVKAISEYPGFCVDWPDLLHIKPTTMLMTDVFDSLPDPKESFYAKENDFYFNAADLSDSYGNMVSILNMETEYELLTAERIAVLNKMYGGRSYCDELTDAWKNLLTFQSHGIVYCASECYCIETGSSLWEAGKYHLDLAKSHAEKITMEALKDLSEKIIKGNKNCKVLVAFNPMAHEVRPILNHIVHFERGFAKDFSIKDGNDFIPFSLTEIKRYDNGSIQSAKVSFKPLLPSMGIKAFYLTKTIESDRKQENTLVINGNSLENNHIRIDFNNQGILAIYSKDQNRIILGKDISMETISRYDKTYAINFRNSFKLNDRISSDGFEIISQDDVKISVMFKYETVNGRHNIIISLYRDSDYFDLTVEHISKQENGALMKMPYGEAKERLWLDFHPSFKGNIKCNTVGDILDEDREFYYSNSWLNVDFKDAGFSILHKGIHSYDNGYVSQEDRRKKEYTISACLACVTNEWVPGMVAFNSQFGDKGVLKQEFRILMNKETDEYKLEKAAREFLFKYPIITVSKFNKNNKLRQKSFLEIDNGGEAFISAFYEDDMTGGKPLIRLYNPKNKTEIVTIKHPFGNVSLEKVRFDGKRLCNKSFFTDSIILLPRTLDTYLFSDYVYSQLTEQSGLVYSNIPYSQRNNQYFFDAPMESYRFVKQYAKYDDGQGNISYIDNLYHDFPFNFIEKEKEGVFRVFEGNVHLSGDIIGNKMRVVTLWNTTKTYGVGTCILTDDYSNRADEPITLFINDVKVNNFNFDITNYVREGDNKLVIRVLAEEPSNNVLMGRSSVRQYLAFDIKDFKQKSEVVNAGFFEKIRKSFIRIGAKYDKNSLLDNRYCVIANPAFNKKDLSGWSKVGDVKVISENNADYYAKVEEGASLMKEILLPEGSYFLKINTKSCKANVTVAILSDDNKKSETFDIKDDKWMVNSFFFKVKQTQKITVILSSENGYVLCDDLNIIKQS